MKIVEPSVTILTPIDGAEVLKAIERAGRTAYKSEDKITDDSAERFVRMLLDRGHESPLEHISITVRIVCDRGVSHELVRHRLASYTQESTRYCNYGDKDMEFIAPIELRGLLQEYQEWQYMCGRAETSYKWLIRNGVKPQTARAVLPNSLKTEVVMTANLREWRHILKLRTAPDAHPDMRRIMLDIQRQFREQIPVIFD